VVIAYGKNVRVYKSLKPQRSRCAGCHDDFYNSNNPLGIKECWHFKDAKVVDALFYPGTWATDKDQILRKKTLSCYRGT